MKSMIRRYEKRKNMELTGTEMREAEAVKKAIESTMALKAGEERIALVDIIFWKRTHTIQGAAMLLHLSERTAQRWHSEFIREVAKQFGLTDE